MKFRFVDELRPKERESLGFKFVEEKETETVHIIQGHVAASEEEYRVSKALDELHFRYSYQYTIGLGGTSRGDIKIDFLVDIAPNRVPLEVQSDRWHSSLFSPLENYRISRIENHLKTKVRFVWEKDLKTQADASAAVRIALMEPA